MTLEALLVPEFSGRTSRPQEHPTGSVQERGLAHSLWAALVAGQRVPAKASPLTLQPKVSFSRFPLSRGKAANFPSDFTVWLRRCARAQAPPEQGRVGKLSGFRMFQVGPP